MAIPLCQGSVREGASSKFNFAPFRTGADLKDRLCLLAPLQEGNDSSSPIEGPGFAICEVLIRAFSRAYGSIIWSGRHGCSTDASAGGGEQS